MLYICNYCGKLSGQPHLAGCKWTSDGAAGFQAVYEQAGAKGDNAGPAGGGGLYHPETRADIESLSTDSLEQEFKIKFKDGASLIIKGKNIASITFG